MRRYSLYFTMDNSLQLQDFKDRLQNIFDCFCDRSSVGQIDGTKFAKLCRDCGILGGGVSPTTVDIIFAKIKPQGQRRIAFREFVQALALIAEEKFPGDDDGFGKLVDLILDNYKGPVVVGTSPETKGIFAKLTDSSQYTGSSSLRFDETGRGLGLAGRDTVAVGVGSQPIYHDGEPVRDLSQIMRTNMRGGTLLSSASAARREESSHHKSASSSSPSSIVKSPTLVRVSARSPVLSTGSRGSLEDAFSASPARGDSSGSSSSPATTRRVLVPRSPAGSGTGESISDLHGIFLAFCAFGATAVVPTEMDSARFAKLCRGAGIVEGSAATGVSDPSTPQIPPAAVDVAFSKAKTKGRRALTYEQFLFALQLLGLEMFPESEPLEAAQRLIALVISKGGPTTNSAVAEPSTADGVFAKLTDTSLFTGAHRHRFDEEGRGRGIEGRDDVPTGASAARVRGPAVKDLSQILRPGFH